DARWPGGWRYRVGRLGDARTTGGTSRMNLLHVIGRQWRQRPARTVLSILSVAIAVAAVFGVALAQSSVRLGYRKLIQAVEGSPALEMLSASGGRIAIDDAPKLSDIPGVRAVVPIV